METTSHCTGPGTGALEDVGGVWKLGLERDATRRDSFFRYLVDDGIGLFDPCCTVQTHSCKHSHVSQSYHAIDADRRCEVFQVFWVRRTQAGGRPGGKLTLAVGVSYAPGVFRPFHRPVPPLSSVNNTWRVEALSVDGEYRGPLTRIELTISKTSRSDTTCYAWCLSGVRRFNDQRAMGRARRSLIGDDAPDFGAGAGACSLQPAACRCRRSPLSPLASRSRSRARSVQFPLPHPPASCLFGGRRHPSRRIWCVRTFPIPWYGDFKTPRRYPPRSEITNIT